MPLPEEGPVKDFIDIYQRDIFALALSLVGGNRDAAYDLTVASFVKVLPGFSPLEKEDRIFCRLVRAVLATGEDVKVIPSRGETEFSGLPAEKRQSLQFVRQALQKLSWATRARILLRDQMHLSYQTIAAIERISPRKAKIQVIEARAALRSSLDEILRTQSV